VPIADAIDGGDGIEVAILPAGEWLTFLHRGPYSHATEPDLAAAHATVRAWAADHDRSVAKEESARDETALSGCIEQYRIGPVEEPDYARRDTEVAYRVDLPRPGRPVGFGRGQADRHKLRP
jgi:GyrI-like small molecule binding domain